MNDDHYEGALLEEIRHQNKAILEGVGALGGVPSKLEKLAEDIGELKLGVKLIKAVVTEHSKKLKDHDNRITILETV